MTEAQFQEFMQAQQAQLTTLLGIYALLEHAAVKKYGVTEVQDVLKHAAANGGQGGAKKP